MNKLKVAKHTHGVAKSSYMKDRAKNRVLNSWVGNLISENFAKVNQGLVEEKIAHSVQWVHKRLK